MVRWLEPNVFGQAFVSATFSVKQFFEKYSEDEKKSNIHGVLDVLKITESWCEWSSVYGNLVLWLEKSKCWTI